jgi:hypothetical protein
MSVLALTKPDVLGSSEQEYRIHSDGFPTFFGKIAVAATLKCG